MLNKIIIVLVIFVAGWLGATYYNSQNPNEEIIGSESDTQNKEIITNNDINTEEQNSTTTEMDETMKNIAKKYCDSIGVSEVYLSKDFIKVVSNMPGGGSSYYPVDGRSQFSCPVVAPGSMSEDCKEITTSSENKWESICSE